MKGFFAAFLLVIGLINVTSENPVIYGWLATIAGAILLVLALSGPYRKPNLHKKNIAGGVSGGLAGGDSYSSSDSCGGDGGGGGD